MSGLKDRLRERRREQWGSDFHGGVPIREPRPEPAKPKTEPKPKPVPPPKPPSPKATIAPAAQPGKRIRATLGVRCPTCGGAKSTVVEARPVIDGVRRRRQCSGCGARWTTREVSVDQSPKEC